MDADLRQSRALRLARATLALTRLSSEFWVLGGAKDPTVPVSESERMIETLRRAGAKDLELTVYPEAKHDSWTETYANPELYTWLLRHQRAKTGAGDN